MLRRFMILAVTICAINVCVVGAQNCTDGFAFPGWKDMTCEYKAGQGNNWSNEISVAGDPNIPEMDLDPADWNKTVILRVSSDDADVTYWPGFTGFWGSTYISEIPRNTSDGDYFMRVGNQTVQFVARAKGNASIKLLLVNVSTINELRNTSIPMY